MGKETAESVKNAIEEVYFMCTWNTFLTVNL